MTSSPMPEKTLQALLAAIEKWKENERLVEEGKEIRTATSDCPLCLLFHPCYNKRPLSEYDERDDCKGCPVKEYTDISLCRGSPYDKIGELDEEDDNYLEKFSSLVTEEREFLESLLPENQ